LFTQNFDETEIVEDSRFDETPVYTIGAVGMEMQYIIVVMPAKKVDVKRGGK
jgi:hypothetical protein